MREIDLLENLISLVENRKKAKIQASEIIEKYGSISNVLREDFKVFENMNILSKKTLEILKNINLIYKHMLFNECFGEEKRISCFEDLMKYLKFQYVDMEREVFKVLYFNTKNILIKDEDIFYGTIDRSIVYIREIIKNILKYNAKSIIVVHNHPSGNLEPSNDDRCLTRNMLKVLKFIDVRLSDHIIISNKGYYSFFENGQI
ncbi:JAB domain-containing protein [Streptobacillus notomytis]|uniref:JAB domain-containing protein n=1 Tax=Streptobacillus notomytis TaxID=1712031 RepID=UPI000936B2A6|nr:JAB domain-containing protein [Streptobacillus notomytis]